MESVPIAATSGPIRFGTSGWRGVLGAEITDERLCALVSASAVWLRGQGGSGRVLVGYDTRFASARLAAVAADALAAEGLAPALASSAVATPVITHALRQRGAAGALVLTASHNPPEDHGLKLFGASGGSVSDAIARRIEKRAAARLRTGRPRSAVSVRRVRRADFDAAYARDVARIVDRAALRRARVRVVYDAMHGAGAGRLDALLRGLGARVSVLRAEPDPTFGGVAPDPRPEQLQALRRAVRAARGLSLGLATDGDADRVAAVDANGTVIDESALAALLIDHLARTGRLRGGVALTVACGGLPERVARAHGLAVSRHGIGFKYLARPLAAGRAELAADESGGFALARFGLDKDGILAGCLFAELVAVSRRSLGVRLRQLEGRYGPSRAGRTALAATPAVRAGLEALAARPPERVGRAPVQRVRDEHGLRLELEDGFVMWRASGTEPVVRTYAEASGPRKLASRLAEAERLLRRAR